MVRRSAEAAIDFLHVDQPRDAMWAYIPVAILTMVGYTILSVEASAGTVSWQTIAVVHLAIVGAILSLLPVLSFLHYDLRLPLTLVVFCALLGPFGAFLGLTTGLFYLLYRRLSSQYIGLLEQMFPEDEYVHPISRLSQRIERGLENVDNDTTAIPFMDIMNFGSLQQRLRAVGLTLRYFHPKLAPVLQKGLRDSNNSVRVLAATSLLALDKSYYDTYQALREEVVKSPRRRVAWKALAQQAESYAGIRILSPERVHKMLEAAREAYSTYAELAGTSETTALALARIELKLGNVDHARQALEALCRKRPIHAEAFQLLAEAYFIERDYARLRDLDTIELSALEGNEIDKELIIALSHFWSGRELATAGDDQHVR